MGSTVRGGGTPFGVTAKPRAVIPKEAGVLTWNGTGILLKLKAIFEITILFWDHLITFGRELKLIWIHPKSRSSILFLAFRYFSLASNLVVTAFLSLDNWSIEAAACSLLTLRLYALGGSLISWCKPLRLLTLYFLRPTTGGD
ncbi:hypothetical protein MPER_09027, partial [Moniliophthora perniciosa FA553]